MICISKHSYIGNTPMIYQSTRVLQTVIMVVATIAIITT